MAEKTNQPNPQPSKRRKPRGAAIEQTELMKALDADPAAAMAALGDEADADWNESAPNGYKELLDAEAE